MDKFAAGIVLYQPDMERLEQNIAAVLPQVDHLFLIDNHSDRFEEIEKRYGSLPNTSLCTFSKNRGIAAALNAMMELARDSGFSWVLTLDQDSVCADDLMAQYLKHLQTENIGIFTPTVLCEGAPNPTLHGQEQEVEYTEQCITSAGLTSVAAWEASGGFDERLFIDYVDFDFCARIKEAGYRILLVRQAVLYQQLGSAQEILFFEKIARLTHIGRLNKKVYTFNHSPKRTYYLVRNSRYYLHRYSNVMDTVTERHRIMKWLLLKLLFEKQRGAQLQAILKGFHDGKKFIREEEAEHGKF